MKFHANENIEGEVVEFLRSLGHDVAYAAETQPRASDDEILASATAERRVLITHDKDFGELCFRKRQPASGVILIRSREQAAPARVRLLQELLSANPGPIEGAFTVLSERGIRRHPLPPRVQESDA